jgi:hypothetical protein
LRIWQVADASAFSASSSISITNRGAVLLRVLAQYGVQSFLPRHMATASFHWYPPLNDDQRGGPDDGWHLYLLVIAGIAILVRDGSACSATLDTSRACPLILM